MLAVFKQYLRDYLRSYPPITLRTALRNLSSAILLSTAGLSPAIRNLRAAARGWLIAVLLSSPSIAAAQTVLVLGDSLSASYGIPRESGWVPLLQQKLTNSNVINASISGDTTEGGLLRLPTLLEKHRPDIVVIELGANDGLRGFQIRRLRDNLEQLIQLSQKTKAKVLLLGIKIPPNYGLRYTSDFYESYTLLAHQYNIPLVPFLLNGVATDPELMQADGLHPRAEAQKKILDNVWPYLQKLL